MLPGRGEVKACPFTLGRSALAGLAPFPSPSREREAREISKR